MNRRRFQSGFTLLELVLVMIIMATAVAITAPKLTNWNRGQELRNCADEFITLTRLARTSAITNGMIYRIEFEADAGKYRLKRQEGTQFVAVSGPMGKDFSAPSGGMIKLEVVLDLYQPDDVTECINFYPTGRAQTARVTFSDKAGMTAEVGCDSPAEEFRVLPTTS
jgi:type II secretion system protein H